ncbi:hypothetical protein D0810_09545 [Vibrio cholerae]|nr:hypothetical protein [Vibrio cholerae]EGR2282015.1 hypothetical protein [Vibrio cholerae]
MPLPLLGGEWEGVFHASLTQLSAAFRSAITKIPHPNPPLEGEGTGFVVIWILWLIVNGQLVYGQKYVTKNLTLAIH